MSQNSKIRAQKREQQAEKKAKKIVNYIFIGLIVMALLLVGVYYACAS